MAAVTAAAAHHFGEPDSTRSMLLDLRDRLEVDGLTLHVKDPTSGAIHPVASVGRTGASVAELQLGVGGDTVGVLAISGDRPPPVDALAPLAATVALAIRGRLLFEGLQSRARDLDREVRLLMALQEIAAAVTRAEHIDDVARVVAMHARRLVRGVGAAVIDTPDAGESVALGAEGTVKPVAVTAALAAMRSGEQQLVPGPVLALPIAVDGEAPVALVVARDGEPFAGTDVEQLVVLGQQAAIAFANARLLEDLRTEQQRREQIAAALVDAQERERQRIAEDIHDGPVQELVGLGLLLDTLATRYESTEAEDDRIAREAARLARGVIGTLRQAIFDLHPMSIQKLGFSSAVRLVLERIEPERIKTTMSGLDQADRLPGTTRTLAFRVVQEAIANSTRHSRAEQLAVTADRNGSRLRIAVVDNGAGFHPEQVPDRVSEGHIGLEAMRQRALLAGAVLTIESAPGEGTRVLLDFDLADD